MCRKDAAIGCRFESSCGVSGSESETYVEKKAVQRNLDENTAAASGQRTLVTWPRGHVCAQAPGTAGAVPLVTKDPPLWQRSSSRLTSQEDLAIKIRSFAQEKTITWGFSKSQEQPLPDCLTRGP